MTATADNTPKFIISLAVVLMMLLLPPFVANEVQARQIHTERSLYRNIRVTEERGLRCLTFTVRKDRRNQSCMNLHHPRYLVFSYTRMMLATLMLKPNPQHILIVGLGGGSLPMTLQQLLPQSHIDVVEIDTAVARVARNYFAFSPAEHTRVIIQDARVFGKRILERGMKKNQRYDLVLLDAFNGDYIPEHLMTREYLAETRKLMTDDGVLAANTFSSSRLYDHESTTYRAVFGPFFNLKFGVSSNRIIIATVGTLPNKSQLALQAQHWKQALNPIDVNLSDYIQYLSREIDWDPNARVLTDQYAPANLLNSR